MMIHFSRSTILLFLLIASCVVSPNSTQAQSSKPSEDKILQSLLKEVRLLRETLQQISLNAYRSQIIFERLRAQNDRVVRLNRQLEDTRDQLANMQVYVAQLSERAKSVESQIAQEADFNRRSQLEREQKEFNYAIEQQKQMLERLRERESRLVTELQTEQEKLNDLENRLEVLEREIENEIERQRSANKEKEQ